MSIERANSAAVQHIAAQQTSEPLQARQRSENSITARNGILLEGRAVKLNALPKEQGAEAMRHKSSSRLAAGFGNLAGSLLAIVAGTGAVLASAALFPFALGVAKLHDAFSSSLKQAKQEAANQLQQLGHPLANSLLDREIATQHFGKVCVSEVMEQYRHDLGGKIPPEQMRSYIAMGERIISALNGQGDDYRGGPLQVQGADGKSYTVEPNLQSARAVSWFLQAKCVVDNAAEDRDPTVLSRGSMVLNDPSGKLFSFLKSAPNAYGRASTHFNDRSNSDKATVFNAGIVGGMSGLIGQGAQIGIEDYGNRMPSDGGCMVFDKLAGKNGQQIYLKWESVGMPTFFGKARHADPADGAAATVKNKMRSPFSCLGHALDFFRSIKSSDIPQTWGVHREAANKGEVNERFKEFSQVAATCANELGKGSDWSKVLINQAKKQGLHFMSDCLDRIAGEYRQQNLEVPASITTAQTNITDFNHTMSTDLGIERKGMELHATLDTAYLAQA
ncbi:MAG: hypothetical protein ACRCR1_02770 [Aeromonas sp.]